MSEEMKHGMEKWIGRSSPVGATALLERVERELNAEPDLEPVVSLDVSRRRLPRPAIALVSAAVLVLALGVVALLTPSTDRESPVVTDPAPATSVPIPTTSPTGELDGPEIATPAVAYDQLLTDEWVSIGHRLGNGFAVGPDGMAHVAYIASRVEAAFEDIPGPVAARLLRCLDPQCSDTEIIDLDSLEVQPERSVWTLPALAAVLPDGSPIFVDEVALYDDGVDPESAEPYQVIRLTVCLDSDCEEVVTTVIDDDEPCDISPDCHFVGAPRVIVSDAGLPIVGFMSGQPPKLKVMECADRLCSSGEVATVASDASLDDIAFDPQGRLLFLYNSSSETRLGICEDTGCSSGVTTATISTEEGWGDWLFFGPDGLPAIWHWSFHETGRNVDIIACLDPDCGSLETLVPGFIAPLSFSEYDPTESTLSEAGQPVRMAGPDGLPLVVFTVTEDRFSAYYEALTGFGSRHLVTRCDDLGCSSGTTVEVANPHLAEEQFAQGWIWHGGTITAGFQPNGLPLLAYGDLDGLHLIRCADPACTTPVP